jgi:hypothetical protein
MYNENASPTVTNCIFAKNHATGTNGAVIYNASSSPTITDSFFCRNTPNVIFGSYTDGGGNNLSLCPPTFMVITELKGDLDGDGDVDFEDFAIFANNWLTPIN